MSPHRNGYDWSFPLVVSLLLVFRGTPHPLHCGCSTDFIMHDTRRARTTQAVSHVRRMN
ncbi:MAG TPA: hypothetical protein VFQ30_09895 [Ktedonobacteraceae bacterium]|nr:hypothetical protein [Ktedonobacteraceae bacterium]